MLVTMSDKELNRINVIEILAGISLGSKTKYRIKLIWDDNYKKRNEEEFFISI